MAFFKNILENKDKMALKKGGKFLAEVYKKRAHSCRTFFGVFSPVQLDFTKFSPFWCPLIVCRFLQPRGFARVAFWISVFV
jgi:hypothetical protein